MSESIGPALGLERASVLMVFIKAPTKGRALSKTTVFRCFQIHHAVSIITEEVSLRSARGVERRANDHQSTKSSSTTGGLDVDRIQHITLCHNVREKEHRVRMWGHRLHRLVT